jgi:diguanylate cyclase
MKGEDLAPLEEYTTQSEEIADILNVYGEWYIATLRHIFYVKEVNEGDFTASPPLLLEWLEENAANNTLDPAIITIIKDIHQELNQVAISLVNTAKSGQIPKLKEFDHFRDVYEDFCGRLERLEKEAGQENTDAETGFRTMNVFQADIKREQDRIARSDKPFCLSFVKINNFEDIEEAGGAAKKRAIQNVAKALKVTLRTFDDAYRFNDSAFFLSLKNTSTAGANAALSRLNNYISSNQMTYETAAGEFALSVSASLAEVQAADDLEALVNLLRKDVEKSGQEPGTVLQLKEMSPLQQYVSSMEE